MSLETELELLASNWICHNDSNVQKAIWDRASLDYRESPVPEIDENPFLRRMNERIPLTAGIRSLDVGCGSGIYSIALALKGVTACGTDISTGMLQAAGDRCARLGLSNIDFLCKDWNDVDIDALNWRGAFDIAFAHMTPAIGDYASLDKLNSCSKALCMIEKPTRRTDNVMDAAFAAIGLPRHDFDGDITRLFSYLWLKGYEPEFFYSKETWNPVKPVEDMVNWCMNRARLKKPLSAEDEVSIAKTVESFSENGYVREHTVTTRVTVIWDVRSNL